MKTAALFLLFIVILSAMFALGLVLSIVVFVIDALAGVIA